MSDQNLNPWTPAGDDQMLERTQQQRDHLKVACEMAFAWLSNVNAMELDGVVAAIVNALTTAGGNFEELRTAGLAVNDGAAGVGGLLSKTDRDCLQQIIRSLGLKPKPEEFVDPDSLQYEVHPFQGDIEVILGCGDGNEGCMVSFHFDLEGKCLKHQVFE